MDARSRWSSPPATGTPPARSTSARSTTTPPRARSCDADPDPGRRDRRTASTTASRCANTAGPHARRRPGRRRADPAGRRRPGDRGRPTATRRSDSTYTVSLTRAPRPHHDGHPARRRAAVPARQRRLDARRWRWSSPPAAPPTRPSTCGRSTTPWSRATTPATVTATVLRDRAPGPAPSRAAPAAATSSPRPAAARGPQPARLPGPDRVRHGAGQVRTHVVQRRERLRSRSSGTRHADVLGPTSTAPTSSPATSPPVTDGLVGGTVTGDHQRPRTITLSGAALPTGTGGLVGALVRIVGRRRRRPVPHRRHQRRHHHHRRRRPGTTGGTTAP